MNLLLLRPVEIDSSGCVTLNDRRAEHLLSVLKVTPGGTVRVGLLNGPLGQAVVIDIAANHVRLRCQFETAAPKAPEDVLLLAMPRPKVLARCLEHATSLGFAHIVLFRSRQTVKSHFESHVLHADQIHRHLLAGLEQARRTFLPTVTVFQRFRPFVEDHLQVLITSHNRYLADPDAVDTLHQCSPENEPFTLVIGPEGGLIPHEVSCFAERGFQLFNAGPHPLRVEAALNFVTGQLVALRENQPRAER
ncbi:MAG TPA: RsmE family RNA methyltransferase [Polyangiaceae bacterium]|nr:RsmE family RNA methyltransferase [Polyangiaceae bacterium]